MFKITNVRLLDPTQNKDQAHVDVTIENGQITDIQPHKTAHFPTDLFNSPHTLVNGEGKWLIPAMVDLCARLREPGHQQHGTLKSEGTAAKQNGFLHVVIPPDTIPVLESGSLIAGLKQRALDDAGIHLQIIGALTKGLEGQQPANLAGLKKGGCVGVSNANATFANEEVVLRALEYAAGLNLSVFFYPLEQSLANDGCAHDGFMATRQGLTPIPSIAETVALAKLLLLVEETGVTAHFGLLSTKESVELIRAAKQKQLPITASVAMHQLLMTDELIDGFNALAHVRPPLREEADRMALLQGVKEGVIDAICSHHEPLSDSAKLAPFADSQPGISTFDTFMPMAMQLVTQYDLAPLDLVKRVVTAPAAIAGIEAQRQQVGGWVLVDPDFAWQVNADELVSKGKNTPYLGQKQMGKVVHTFY